MDTQPTLLSGKAFVLGTLLIAAGLLGAAGLKAHSDLEATSLQRSLSAPGYASRNVTSDQAKWSLELGRSSNGTSTTFSAEQQLKTDIDRVIAQLDAAGVKNPIVSRQPFQGSPASYGYYDEPRNPAPGSSGSQRVVIESPEVKKLSDATASIVETLTRDGANIYQNQMEFFYAKRDDLRRELLQEAAKDARRQAEGINGGRTGKLLRLDGGTYLSVTPINSYAGSYYGNTDDTSSIEKKVSIEVTATFLLE